MIQMTHLCTLNAVLLSLPPPHINNYLSQTRFGNNSMVFKIISRLFLGFNGVYETFFYKFTSKVEDSVLRGCDTVSFVE